MREVTLWWSLPVPAMIIVNGRDSTIRAFRAQRLQIQLGTLREA